MTENLLGHFNSTATTVIKQTKITSCALHLIVVSGKENKIVARSKFETTNSMKTEKAQTTNFALLFLLLFLKG